MREQRWESQDPVSFKEILTLGQKLASRGLHSTDPEKDGICYIEEFHVERPDDIQQLDSWPTEDLTMVRVLDDWQGDFFLLAGRYHTVFQRHQDINAYCSISHPWQLSYPQATLFPQAMFWTGFRHTHSFIRVRLHTTEVVAPGETWANHQRPVWIEERFQAFRTAIEVLEVPIEPGVNNNMVTLQLTEEGHPFFCSWPDAFGPCQFELNSSDSFEFLVPACRLAATHGSRPAPVRIYLTGFAQETLKEFEEVEPNSRFLYRCSAHCRLLDLPEMLTTLGRSGRLYTTLCEFQTGTMVAEGQDAASIIGVVGIKGQLYIEVRFNMMPLPREDMNEWLEQLLGVPMMYAPLSPFP